MSDLLIPITGSSELSAQTKKNYKSKISAICTKADENDVRNILLNPDKFIPLLKAWYPKLTSLKAHLSCMLGLFKYNIKLHADYPDVQKKWFEAFTVADTAVNDRYETNEPTDRQKEGYVPYNKIIQARNLLGKGSINRVLLGMYTHLKPMRCEYARVALFDGTPPTDNVEPNYIILSTGKLIISKFKTQKHHDAYDIQIPKPLMDDIKKSLEFHPREWLFTNSKHEPYTNATFSAWAMKEFKLIFGKPLTVALIRHSYINSLDFNALTIVEKKQIALSMGHTVGTQDMYRLIFKDKDNC